MPVSTSPRVRISVSAPAPPSSGLPDAPSWVTALVANRFAQVATANTISSVNPANDSELNPGGGNPAWNGTSGQRAHVTAWNGGALADNIGARGTFLTFGGGHKDYYGNEVYGLDLGLLTWARLSNPYPTPNDGLQAATGWHPAHTGQPNGSPGVPHTYRFLQYIRSMKCLVTPTTQKDNSGAGGRISKVGLFPLPGAAFTQYQWQEGSTPPGGGYDPTYSDGWGVLDTTRNRIVVHGGGGRSGSVLASIDPTTGEDQGEYGTWSLYGNKISTSGVGSAYDPVNDCIITFAADGRLRGLDASNLGGSVVTLTTNTPPAGLSIGMGFQYSYALGGFVMWNNGSDVYLLKMNAGSGNWKTNGWTWSLLTTNTTVAPIKAGNNTYNRFQVMRYANAEVALVVNGVTEPLYAFRLS